jgi:hypothetical protein
MFSTDFGSFDPEVESDLQFLGYATASVLAQLLFLVGVLWIG